MGIPRSACSLLSLLLLTGGGGQTLADEAVVSAAEPILEQFCYGCHGPNSQQSGINFADLLTQRPLVKDHETWTRAIRALESGSMPPEGAPPPSDEQRIALLAKLDEAINQFDYSSVNDPGYEPLRRLTHKEYDNTIRDLIGADLKLASQFTSEMTGETGFDNSATTLYLQSSLMERYILAAERLVEDALPDIPVTPRHRKAHETVFVASPGPGVAEGHAIDRIVRRFLSRAFRRPPTEPEIDRAKSKYRTGRASGMTFEQAVKGVISATLISPNFLLRIESAPASSGEWRINDWELASRLSYFLWASMPDDELFDLAASGRLHEPDILASQLHRMLADEKADSLGTVMAAQWLGFGRVGKTVRLGAIDFPWCTDSLMDSMRAESSMFFMSLLRENAPISRLVDADYTYVNQELAETLYDMKGVYGSHMRRVALEDSSRGGILGHGSSLAITSNYNRTSPVKRGHWILETVLGTPPPPPPPNAGAFDQEVNSNKELTFREKLAFHSQHDTCQSCHAQFDPLGFSLENFDYFGRWRDTYSFRIRIKKPEDINDDPESNFRRVYKEIDASGSLPEGASFEGPQGMKQALIENRHDDLVRQTVSKTLAYALGRPLEYYDERAVRRIVAALEADGFRFQTLLREVVQSYPFLHKRHPANEAGR